VGFGERLQREREMRGITLDEIATATKIGTRSLRALELEEFEKLPGGIFNKGFVRAYARFLGIDEEQAVADYLTAIGEPTRKDALDPEQAKTLEDNWKPPKSDESPGSASGALRFVAFMLVLLLLVGGGITAWSYRAQVVARYQQWKERRHPSLQAVAPVQPPAVTTPQPVTATEAAPVVPSPVATEPAPSSTAVSPKANEAPPQAANSAAGPTATSAASADEFVVLVHARQDSWVEIVADGKPILKGTLIARTDRSVRARQNVKITAGNAGGLELSFNGRPQAPLGGEKEVRTVTFTPAGVQQ
jgi:cytoskeleton protein RodZ